MTKKDDSIITVVKNIYLTKLCQTCNVFLLPLRHKIRLHLYSSNSSNTTGQTTNEMGWHQGQPIRLQGWYFLATPLSHTFSLRTFGVGSDTAGYISLSSGSHCFKALRQVYTCKVTSESQISINII